MVGLKPGTVYQIRVIAHTPAGQTVHYFQAKTKNSSIGENLRIGTILNEAISSNIAPTK